MLDCEVQDISQGETACNVTLQAIDPTDAGEYRPVVACNARLTALVDQPVARPVNPKIENAFTYHPPQPGQPEKYTNLRAKAKELAYLIDELCPASREQSVAFTHLETAIMWANAAIARNS